MKIKRFNNVHLRALIILYLHRYCIGKIGLHNGQVCVTMLKLNQAYKKINPKTFVESALFEARNNWFTFVNADPSELFDESFDKVIADIIE